MFTTSRSTFDAAPGLGATAKHHSPFPLPPSACRSSFIVHRSSFGFTLIELLIVISILAILSSMVLFALAGAEGTAKEMRTQATITKLHNLVMQKYESYRTRRVPMPSAEDFIDQNGNGRYDPGEPFTDLNGNGRYDYIAPNRAAMQRLVRIRDLMRMEMPERFTDIPDQVNNIYMPVTAGTAIPSVARSYRRALPPDITTNPNKYEQFRSAECLFLFITRGIDDPDVMEQFAPSEIGDVDEDGLREFLDAWGRPISFLRWSPGFVSSLQPEPPYKEHDPFDPRKVHKPPTNNADPNYWADFANTGVHPPLFPLIYSGGPDGILGLHAGSDDPSLELNYSVKNSNPYSPHEGALIGTPLNETDHVDNITNHDS